MITYIQEPVTSIQTLLFHDDFVRVMIQQEDQRVFVIENMGFPAMFCRASSKDPQHTMNRASTVDKGEIDYEETPDLV